MIQLFSVMATGLLCNSMRPVVSFFCFCMFVNIYVNKKQKKAITKIKKNLKNEIELYKMHDHEVKWQAAVTVN